MNEKVFKVLDVIVKVAGIVSTVAQIIAQAFKTNNSVVPTASSDEALVRQFMNEEMK